MTASAPKIIFGASELEATGCVEMRHTVGRRCIFDGKLSAALYEELKMLDQNHYSWSVYAEPTREFLR